MKSLFGKVLAGALGFAAAIGISAFAADIKDLKVEVPAEIPTEGTAVVTVTGKIAPGAEATILVAEDTVSVLEAILDSDIQYINQDSVKADGEFEFKAVLKVGAKYNVWCGGTEVAQVGKDVADLMPAVASKFKIVGSVTLPDGAQLNKVTAVATGEGEASVTAVPDEMGTYTIEVDNGTYTVVVGRPGYLYRTFSNVKVSDSDVTLAATALLAGEFDEDGAITISDLTELIKVYQKPEFDAQFDLDDSGDVTISDLTILIRSFQKEYE